MKIILASIILILLTTNVFAQTNATRKRIAAENQLINEIWGNDEKFNILEVPEKWQNESAVILYQKIHFEHHKGSSKNYRHVNETVRKRVKLLDKAALEEFATFYYVKYEPLYYTSQPSLKIRNGFRVFKAGGDTVEVDLVGEAVSYGDVPVKFRSYSNSSDINYQKVAIPGLEIGDVVDFYYSMERNILCGNRYTFSPFIFELEDEYPILNQTIEFELEDGYYINFKTYNGAGELIDKTETEYNKRGKEVKPKTRLYLLEDTDREKTKDEKFDYSLRTSPVVKFQVYFIHPKVVQNSIQFLGTENVPRNYEPTATEMRNVAAWSYSSVGSEKAKETLKWLKKYHKDADKLTLAKLSYYELRLRYLITLEGTYNRFRDEIGTWSFIDDMHYLFNKLRIDHDILVAIPAHLGTQEDLLLAQELQFIICARIDGEEIYFSPADYYSEYTDWDFTMMGVKAVKLNEEFDFSSPQHPWVTLKSETADQNVEHHDVAISFNEDLDKVDLTRTVTTTGRLKRTESSSMLYIDDFLHTDRRMHDPEYVAGPPLRKRAQREEWLADSTEEKSKREEKRLEIFEQRWKDNDFDIEEYKSFEIIELGRQVEPLKFVYKENVLLNDLIKQAGNNYIFEVGRIIGGQISLTDKEKNERTKDVFINYPKTYEYTINIQIPDGFTVADFDELNSNVENEAGRFTSTAKLNGNVLTVTTEKVYKTHYLPNAQWSLLVEMLELAEVFMNKKVVIKKQA